MFKTLIYGFTWCVLASTTTLNSNENVEVRLLDNQNAPLVATLDMSKADERIKQFVSDAIETKMQNIEKTIKSKKFVSDALKAIMTEQEMNLRSQIANFERNLTDQLTNYIDNKVNKTEEEKEKTEESKQRPIDCGDVKTKTGNGIYKIYPKHSVIGFDVYCDFEIDNSGWTVFQRRLNGSTDFYRGWNSYVNGFGNLGAEFWLEKTEEPNQHPIDCKDVKLHKGNGVYKIYPDPLEPGFDVYCDFETDNGGWTVFQRRSNGQTDFYRGWEAYKIGFGDLEAEFWLGNQRIHTLTAAGKSELRVDMSDFDGNRAYAKYSTFAVGDAVTNYKLTVAGYGGNAGDSLDYSNGQAFTTKDRDNDPWTSSNFKNNCGKYHQGAWWYQQCAHSNLNGLYIEGGKTSREGMFWHFWKNNQYSMKSSSMMIRRL